MRLNIVNKSTNPLPAVQSKGAAGLDIQANLELPVHIPPGTRVLIPTGIYMEFDQGYECQVRPRSGLAAKFGITVLNTPGTIDSDYRGEVLVILYNSSSVSYTVNHGDRIAQLVFNKIELPIIYECASVESLSFTERGDKGCGSTGV